MSNEQDKPNNNSLKEWVTRSMGFVDKMCCYSYSAEQIQTERDPIQVDRSFDPSWNMLLDANDDDDDDDMLDRRSTNSFFLSRHLAEKEKLRKHSGQSVSTTTTAATSTTGDDIRTKFPPKFAQVTQSSNYQRKPREISVPTRTPLTLRPKPSNALPAVSFHTDTERYQC